MAKYRTYGYIDELRQRRKRRKIKIAFLVLFFLVALIVFSVYALFFSSWLSVKEIQISGHKDIPEEEIKNLISDYLNRKYLFDYIKPFSNIFLASSESIEHFLRSKFLMIEKVSVNKSLFKKNLSVEIKERDGVGVYCKIDAGICFYFDREGFLFKESSRFSGEVFLIIEDDRGRDFNLADSFDDRELFEKVNLTKNILDDLKFIDYSNFYLPRGSFEFWVKTKESWYIYLDKESDIPTQLVVLKKFLEEKLSSDRRQNLQYIDLRVNNRIYYK